MEFFRFVTHYELVQLRDVLFFSKLLNVQREILNLNLYKYQDELTLHICLFICSSTYLHELALRIFRHNLHYQQTHSFPFNGPTTLSICQSAISPLLWSSGKVAARNVCDIEHPQTKILIFKWRRVKGWVHYLPSFEPWPLKHVVNQHFATQYNTQCQKADIFI